MNDLDTRSVPEPTLRRLPSYHRYLQSLTEEDVEFVSCSRIGTALNLDPTQIRKDLAATGIVGRPKVGYRTEELIDSIERFLGWKKAREALLVGVGNLGTALLGFDTFNQHGIRIVAAFDTDPAKIGTEVHGHKVFSLDRLPDLASRMRILVGIITTPAEAAGEVAELLFDSGIHAIWNFAPTPLEAPAEVIIQNEDLFASLAVLSSKLESALTRGRSSGATAEAGNK